MSRVDLLLVISWRIASEQFRDAAYSTGDHELKRRLGDRALALAQQAEAYERRKNAEQYTALTRDETRWSVGAERER